MSEATVTRETLEKGVAESQAHLDGLKSALAELESKIPEIMAGGDFEAIASHGAKISATKAQIATAANRVQSATDQLTSFAISERFDATTEARSPINKYVFDNVAKKPPTFPITSYKATVKLVDGNFTVDGVVSLATDVKSIDAALATMFNDVKQTFIDAGATEMEIEVANIGKPDATSAIRLARKLAPRIAAPRTPGAGSTTSNGDRAGKLGWKVNATGAVLSSRELLDYVIANHPEIVEKHSVAFANYNENGTKMFGLSNLAKSIVEKDGIATAAE